MVVFARSKWDFQAGMWAFEEVAEVMACAGVEGTDKIVYTYRKITHACTHTHTYTHTHLCISTMWVTF